VDHWRVRRWLDGCIQRVVVDGSMSGWRPETSGATLRSVLGPILFHIFVGSMDSGIEHSPGKLAGDTKLSGADVTPEGRGAIQRDPDTLETSAGASLMTFTRAKCKVLHLGRASPKHGYGLGDEGVESSPQEKDPGMQRLGAADGLLGYLV